MFGLCTLCQEFSVKPSLGCKLVTGVVKLLLFKCFGTFCGVICGTLFSHVIEAIGPMLCFAVNLGQTDDTNCLSVIQVKMINICFQM